MPLSCGVLDRVLSARPSINLVGDEVEPAKDPVELYLHYSLTQYTNRDPQLQLRKTQVKLTNITLILPLAPSTFFPSPSPLEVCMLVQSLHGF